jgi:hypothetical protein
LTSAADCSEKVTVASIYPDLTVLCFGYVEPPLAVNVDSPNTCEAVARVFDATDTKFFNQTKSGNGIRMPFASRP